MLYCYVSKKINKLYNNKSQLTCNYLMRNTFYYYKIITKKLKSYLCFTKLFTYEYNVFHYSP